MHKIRAKTVLIIILVFGLCCAIAGFAYTQIIKKMHPIKYEQSVQLYAKEYDIDPFLVYAFICTESGFDETAISSVGARGLMQITEETFAWIKSKIAPKEDIVFDDMFKADYVIRFGAYYISKSLNRYSNDVSTAAAAYHSGWGTVDKLLQSNENSANASTLVSFPYKQMNLYVHKINKNYILYKKLYAENGKN